MQRELELAAELATRYEAKLHVIHVLLRGDVPQDIRDLSDVEGVREPPFATGGGFVDASLAKEVLQDIGEKQLQRGQQTAKDLGAKDVEANWFEGDPTQVILEHAKEKGVDMIVMGSRGLSEIKSLLDWQRLPQNRPSI